MTACLIFSLFSDRFRPKSHTRHGITQGLTRFRDIDLGVKGQGQDHKKCFLRPRVLIFLRFPTDFAQNRIKYVASPMVSSVFVTLTSGSKVKFKVIKSVW